MQVELIVAIILHLLPGTFWAGSTFALARNGGLGAEALLWPQIGAGVVAMIAGIYLWIQLHAGSFGRFEQVLALGALAAVIAMILQIVICGPAVRALMSGSDGQLAARHRAALGYRISGGFLALAIIFMGAGRYVG